MNQSHIQNRTLRTLLFNKSRRSAWVWSPSCSPHGLNPHPEYCMSKNTQAQDRDSVSTSCNKLDK